LLISSAKLLQIVHLCKYLGRKVLDNAYFFPIFVNFLRFRYIFRGENEEVGVKNAVKESVFRFAMATKLSFQTKIVVEKFAYLKNLL